MLASKSVGLLDKSDGGAGCRGAGAGGFSYPGIGAIFWVASSQHAQSLLQLLLVGKDIVDVCVGFICRHPGEEKKKKKTQRHRDTPGENCTVLTNDCSGREFGPRPRGGSDARD